LPVPSDPNVLVGLTTSDDAGVYRLSDDLALVQTVDFFTPIVDDPYDFGRIAATNALSDVYAMGGKPLTALNIAAFPTDTVDHAILARILEGGSAVAAAAGVVILGGHTVKDDEPKYGMSVTGTVDPRHIVTNAGARPGDYLLLTKPIGSGILTTARKKDAIDDAALAPAIGEMTRLNAAARDVMLAHHVHAATDITGFGLIGHAAEMARASLVGLEIASAQVPLFAGVPGLIERGFVPGGTEDNLVHHSNFTSYADYVSITLRTVLSDAMTSGGLLIAASPNDIRAMYTALASTHTCAIVGRVTEDGQGTISVV
jgi:selenide,water dikinase